MRDKVGQGLSEKIDCESQRRPDHPGKEQEMRMNVG